MEGNSRPVVVWNLVPPGPPPPGPALHTRAKQRPFGLLQSLEPPRGPDYFPMEKFRRPSRSDGVGTTGIGGGGGGGVDGGWRNTNRSHGTHGFASSGRTTNSDQRYTSDAAGPSRGLASFSPALSQASSTMISTPVQRTQTQQAEGLTLFGGKAAYSTPARSDSGSGGGRSPLFSHTPVSSSTPSETPYGGGGGSSGSRISGGGDLPQFKQTAREVEEEEEMQNRRDGGGEYPSHRTAKRGVLSRPSTYLSPSPGMASPPSAPTSHDGGGGRASGTSFSSPSAHRFDTPSPMAPSPRIAARPGQGSPAAPTSSARKRPRAASTAVAAASAASAHPLASGGLQLARSAGWNGSGDDGGASPAGGRTWGGVATNGISSRRRQQQQHLRERQESPRLSAQERGRGGTEAGEGVGGARRVLSGTPSNISPRSPRPGQKKNKSPSQSLRGGGGGRANGEGGAGTGKAGFSSPRSQQRPPPTPRRYKLEDFAGADDACFNPGACPQGLAVFLERCEASGVVSLSMLWADLTTSFSAMTVKSCVPSQSCFRWNCACGRQPRAQQATAPIIGAIVYLPARQERTSHGILAGAISATSDVQRYNQEGEEEDEDFPEGETYLLPLGACSGEDKEAVEAGGYQLPIACGASYDERWAALAKLLSLPVKKVAFNAQVALMPLVAWSRRPQSKTFLSRSGGDLAGTVRETMSKVDGTQCERGPTCGDTGAVSGLFDPRVAAWMLDTGSSTDKTLEFEALCVSWLKDQAGKAGDSANRSDGGARGPKDRLSAIVGAVLHTEECSRRALALAGKISDELEGAKMLAACEQVEMPAIPVLAGMEVSGVVFLPERVSRFSDALGDHLEALRLAAVKAIGGRDFNLASPDQVAEVLFKFLKLPSPPVKTGSVHASTSAEVLAGLQGKHAVVAPILEFRGVNKYKTTYVDKLAERALGAAAADSAVPASQGTGMGAVRIHAAWNQTSARTGRLSCSRPNLQQMPKSSDPLAGVAGVNVRDSFSASKSFTLMAADYSQIEMRVLADACRDPGLRSLFTSLGGAGGGGGDVYRKLAAQVFGKDETCVGDNERTRAKVVCLGIIYGMGTPQVAKKLEVTDSQAQGLVRSFLKAFPGIEPFMAATRRYAREKGYVCTLTGRRRHLPEINNSRNAAMKAQAERQAVNSVVQGTAADIMKTAMILVARRLDAWRLNLEEGLDCPRLIMQIHDELVLECPACEEDLERLKGLLNECMEVEAPAMLGIKCPLTVNMLVGMSWGSMRRVVPHGQDDVDGASGSE